MRRIFATAAATLLSAFAPAARAAVNQASWGTVDGKPVALYTLTSPQLTVTLTNFGAHVVTILAPDRDGKKTDVVLGYKDLAGYETDNKTYMGSIVGRYGNRIAKASFTLDGKTYHIPANDHGNALHGGTIGFDRKVWTGEVKGNGVEFTLVSPEGDMGFPGQLTAHVLYRLEGDHLRIEYTATTTKPTVVALTNHTYFNLAGEASGTILNQRLMLAADRFTPVDATLIPTGKLLPVAGTPLDFRSGTAIGSRLEATNDQMAIAGRGYDFNYVLNGGGPGEHLAAKAMDPASGRTLTVTTTEPGVQFYSGNSLPGTFTGVGGKPYGKYDGFCLETQHFPDSPNEPSFPTTALRPGQVLHSTTVFTFGVQR